MRIVPTEKFARQLADAPAEIQKAWTRRSALLEQNLQHPSLHAKKFDEANDVWQARVTLDWRVYLKIEGDTILLLSLIPHPK